MVCDVTESSDRTLLYRNEEKSRDKAAKEKRKMENKDKDADKGYWFEVLSIFYIVVYCVLYEWVLHGMHSYSVARSILGCYALIVLPAIFAEPKVASYFFKVTTIVHFASH
uniref:uncharacterized protein LOC108950244 isoform X1 n=1 Tax=Ciona intestinalis TaxID=7719 RepID=UPI000EF4ABE0|nr:uncharacterized protein LOC108950244 isoform X1 [Ciona intestinalis]|eukprot:XP_026694175.1 uncharacterized protein LOC108950244 isoform X1 [Ciona intestinalis]